MRKRQRVWAFIMQTNHSKVYKENRQDDSSGGTKFPLLCWKKEPGNNEGDIEGLELFREKVGLL